MCVVMMIPITIRTFCIMNTDSCPENAISDGNEFVTLTQYLRDFSYPIDVCQTAIDREGIFQLTPSGPLPHKGYDDDDVVLQALSFLAAYDEAHDWLSVGSWTDEQIDCEGGAEFGWPIFMLPNFDAIDKELHPKFTSISALLSKSDAPAHTAIAIEIESRGVWKRHGAKKFVQHNADSLVAVDALTGLSINLMHTRNPPPPEYEAFFEDEDTLHTFGWPNEELPRFRTSDEERWIETFHRLEIRCALYTPEIMTVGRLLLTRQATPGLIKTAMENFGIYGRDPHGRIRKYADGDPHLENFDHALAAYASMMTRGGVPDVGNLEPIEYANFGWPRDRLPDFDQLANEPIPGDSIDAHEASVGKNFVESAHALSNLGHGDSPQSSDMRFPWGSHSTKDLEDLSAAAIHWWSDYIPGDPSTAPKSDNVERWLIEEKGTVEAKAKAIASILRPIDLKPGPRRTRATKK